jgi:hypothetical protein
MKRGLQSVLQGAAVAAIALLLLWGVPKYIEWAYSRAISASIQASGNLHQFDVAAFLTTLGTWVAVPCLAIGLLVGAVAYFRRNSTP